MNNLTICLLFATVLALSGCASPIDVMSQTTQVYPSVPVGHVRVSTRPPRGQYQVIALISAESEKGGESTVHFSRRLQEKGAALGADYILIIEQHSNHYIAPATGETFSTENAYATAYPNADGSVSATGYGTTDSSSFYLPAHPYATTSVTAKALRMISGTNEPDMSQPPLVHR